MPLQDKVSATENPDVTTVTNTEQRDGQAMNMLSANQPKDVVKGFQSNIATVQKPADTPCQQDKGFSRDALRSYQESSNPGQQPAAEDDQLSGDSDQLEDSGPFLGGDTLNGSDMMRRHHGYEMEEAEQLEKLEIFAKEFKQKRIKMGFTQGDVGLAMGRLYNNDFSQTTISRFEALNLSFKNMCKLKPLLERWLQDTNNVLMTAKDGRPVVMPQLDPQYQTSRKRKKRTSIDQKKRSTLDVIFSQNPKPNSDDLHSIAEECCLDKEVVRVWFCNRRQKEKRIAMHERESQNEGALSSPDSPQSAPFLQGGSGTFSGGLDSAPRDHSPALSAIKHSAASMTHPLPDKGRHFSAPVMSRGDVLGPSDVDKAHMGAMTHGDAPALLGVQGGHPMLGPPRVTNSSVESTTLSYTPPFLLKAGLAKAPVPYTTNGAVASDSAPFSAQSGAAANMSAHQLLQNYGSKYHGTMLPPPPPTVLAPAAFQPTMPMPLMHPNGSSGASARTATTNALNMK